VSPQTSVEVEVAALREAGYCRHRVAGLLGPGEPKVSLIV
jgi:hypothetical protein